MTRFAHALGDSGLALRHLVVTLVVATLLVGCGALRKELPAQREVVTAVELEGLRVVPAAALLKELSTTKTPRFLGIWEGIAFPYEVFDEALLARDLERVERFLRARGYYEAKVTAARVLHLPDQRVAVTIAVHEGEPVIVDEIQLPGIERVPVDASGKPVAVTTLLRAIALRSGQPLDEAPYRSSAEAIEVALGNLGFAFARVVPSAQVDIARHRAVVAYAIEAGPRAVFGAITFEGLADVPEAPLRRALLFEEGDPYSRDAVKDAQRALVALGVFAQVTFQEDLRNPASQRVAIKFLVKESALRTIRAGVSASIDTIRTLLQARLGWEHRNFLGDARRLSLTTEPGVVLYPVRLGSGSAPVSKLLAQARTRAELRQPAFLEGRTEGFVSLQYNIYPLLYELPEGTDPTAERIIGYNEVQQTIGLQRSFFDFHLQLSPSMNVRANYPFIYQGDWPEGLQKVVATYPAVFAALDFRDNVLMPRRGLYASMDAQAAGMIGLGTMRDIRLQPELRTYIPLSRSVTLALRGTLGFLLPLDYGQSLDPANASDPAYASPDSPGTISDQQKLLFRVFYSGGSNSNRGYPFRGAGPHGPLGFLVPSSVRCDFVAPPEGQDPSCTRAQGGVSLWEGTAELRFPLSETVSTALFTDGSYLSRKTLHLSWRAPRLSPGMGLRYISPVGPLRVDVGYRAIRTFVKDDPATEEDEALASLEGEPEPTHLRLWPTQLRVPVAVHIAVGEAF